MHFEDTHQDAAASPAGGPRSGRTPISRRQAIVRMSAVATAGAAAWVVPEILTAKPAAGASLSGTAAPPVPPGSGGQTPPGSGGPIGSPVSTASPIGSPVSTAGPSGSPVSTASPSGVTSAAATPPSGPTSGVTTAAATQPSGQLAYSGLDIERDAQIGAALIAGGWVIHHWASRTQEGRPTA